MNSHLHRIQHFKGSAHEIGLTAGRIIGERLEHNICRYISFLGNSIDMERLRAGATPWLRRLPQRFQEELEGLAAGAGIPLQRVAEWTYADECAARQCSGVICRTENRVWVARNNDLYLPELWGYAAVKEIEGRIPTIYFSMEGDVFTPTGINKDRLWLHYNYLPKLDKPTPDKPQVPPHVFLTEALELCHTIGDVERMFNEMDRNGSMLLFAVDGKTDEFALFECTCFRHCRVEPSDGWIAGTNHYRKFKDAELENSAAPASTLTRLSRVEGMMRSLCEVKKPIDLPADLIGILADDEVERRAKDFVTVYSNVVCPGSGEIWYTFGGYPAASKGNWQRLDWPWKDRSA